MATGLLQENVAEPHVAVGVDALGHTALVGHYNQPKTRFLQQIQGLWHTGQHFKITHPVGIIRIIAIQYAIAIEKDATTHGAKMQSTYVSSKKYVLGFLLNLTFAKGK